MLQSRVNLKARLWTWPGHKQDRYSIGRIFKCWTYVIEVILLQEYLKFTFADVLQLVLLGAHLEDGLRGRRHVVNPSRKLRVLKSWKERGRTWKPARVISKETSSGRLTTPATDLTRDMKSSGNQTMQMSSTTIIPPIPYFTTFFFFCPRGCGYLCMGWVGGKRKQRVFLRYRKGVFQRSAATRAPSQTPSNISG